MSQIFVGPVAGANFTWIRFDEKEKHDVYETNPFISYHAGANVSFKVRNRFFLHTSFIYSVKGKVMDNPSDPVFHHEAKYKYIEIPLVYAVDFKGTVGNNKVYKWYFGAGPNLSYWLSGKGSFSSSPLMESNIDRLDYDIVFRKDAEELAMDEMTIEDPNRIQLGLNLATGIVFEPMENQKLMLNVRYEIGHSYMSRTSDGVFAATFERDDMRIRSHGLRLSLSYMIDLRIENRKKGKSTIKRKNVR